MRQYAVTWFCVWSLLLTMTVENDLHELIAAILKPFKGKHENTCPC